MKIGKGEREEESSGDWGEGSEDCCCYSCFRFLLKIRVFPKTPQHLLTQDPVTFQYFFDQVSGYHDNSHVYWLVVTMTMVISESQLVDSQCRDGADVQYMQYLSKSCITSPQIR